MPTYQYACTACGHQLEAVQSFSDAPLTICPECEGQLRKVFSSVGIVFKGSGFYRTDSRSGSTSSESTSSNGTAKSESSNTASSSSTSSSSGSSTTSGSPASGAASGSSEAKSDTSKKSSTSAAAS